MESMGRVESNGARAQSASVWRSWVLSGWGGARQRASAGLLEIAPDTSAALRVCGNVGRDLGLLRGGVLLRGCGQHAGTAQRRGAQFRGTAWTLWEAQKRMGTT